MFGFFVALQCFLYTHILKHFRRTANIPLKCRKKRQKNIHCNTNSFLAQNLKQYVTVIFFFFTSVFFNLK